MKLTPYVEYLILISLVAVFGAATYQRNLVWKDNFTLWSDVVEKFPNKARPYNNLADACEKMGLIDRAILLAKKSIALNPNLAEPHNNLGLCYFEKGWTDKAALEFKRAIRISPNSARAYSNLGLAYSRQGQKSMAIAQHKQALEVNPYFEKVLKERGIYNRQLMKSITQLGSVKNIREISLDIREVFVTSHDISPKWHVLMQAAFQKHTDNR